MGLMEFLELMEFSTSAHFNTIVLEGFLETMELNQEHLLAMILNLVV